MADEPVTGVTNSTSVTATQTGAPEAAATTTSTTGETTTPDASQQGTSDGQAAAVADPLDATAGGLADTGVDAAAADDAGEPDAAGSDDPAAGDTETLTGAPEGAYEIALPEGMSLNTEALEAITPLAKELNLSNAGLSRLAAEAMPIAEQVFVKSQVEAVVAQRKAWETDARAMVQGGKLSDGTVVEASPVYAGENMDTVMSTAARAIDRFTSDGAGQPLLFPAAKVNKETGEPEAGTFRDFLATTGLGNHPAMQQLAYLAGKAIAEDTDFERPGATPATKLSREAKYYSRSNTTT